MHTILEAYRVSCNQITVRITELSLLMKAAQTQSEYDALSSRKQLLLTERLELLEDMQAMKPYIKECVNAE